MLEVSHSKTQIVADDVIVAELWRHGIRLFHAPESHAHAHLVPARLLAAMALSEDPRLRMALVVLFLHQPVFCADVEAAAALLGETQFAQQLRLYYQAAVYLQREVGVPGRDTLPDLYATRFGSPQPVFGASVDATNAALDVLAQTHSALPLPFAAVVNWRNTYRKQVPLYLHKIAHGYA